MESNRNLIEAFKEDVRKLYAFNMPILLQGAKIEVVDADKYTALKNRIRDLCMSIVISIDDKTKWEIIMKVDDDFDEEIRNNHKK